MSRAEAKGVLMIVAGDSALRVCPPLVVTEAELEEGVRVLDDVLVSLRHSKEGSARGAEA